MRFWLPPILCAVMIGCVTVGHRGVASSSTIRTRVKADCSRDLTNQEFSKSDDVVTAANTILKQVVPDIALGLHRLGPSDFEIRDTGSENRRIVIHARFEFLPRVKTDDRDYNPLYTPTGAGPNPIRTLYIEEIRILTYTAVDSRLGDPLKRLGIGTVLMAAAAKIAMINQVYSISGKLDEDNKTELWKELQESKDMVRAIEAAPTRRVLKSLGYEADLDHSAIVVGRDKAASYFMVTQMVAPGTSPD